MEQLLKTVQNSADFRDMVMTADREGREVHVRLHGFSGPTYRIFPRHVDPFQKITLNDLFGSHWAPIYMEDFAQALITTGSSDAPPKVDIFTLRAP